MNFSTFFQKKQKIITIFLIVALSVLVYLNSFLPRYNTGNFENLKKLAYDNCYNSLIMQNIEATLATIQCKNYIEQYGDQIVKTYEDLYSWEEGRYLTGIDPYYYYRLTKNLIEKGHYYETLKEYDEDLDGKKEKVPYDDKQYAPPGRPMSEKAPFWVYFQYYSYKIFSSIFEDWKGKLMGFLYWLPVYLAPISSVLAFFIGYKLFNMWIGLLFGLIMVFNGTFLSRSSAGFADTDSLNVVLPLASFLFFIMSFYSKKIISKAIFGVLSSLFLALFAWHWQGWWYILWVILSFLGFKFLQYFIESYKENKEKNKERGLKIISSLKLFFKKEKNKELIFFSIAYFLSIILLVSFFTSFKNFLGFLISPIKIFLGYDKPSTGYWPNTLLTVAEAGDIEGLKEIMNTVFIFGPINMKILAWLGFFSSFYLVYYSIKRKRYELLSLILWLLAAILFSLKGVRFLMYLGIPLSLLAAFGIYHIARKLSEKVSEIERFKVKEIDRFVKFTILSIITLIIVLKASILYNNPYNIVFGQFNDNWKKTMDYIKNNDYDVITSWWDFGHYFIAMSKKMVTFDGATQTTPRAFWVGKALQSEENLSKGIITALTTNGDDFFNFIITYLSALELGYSKDKALEIAKIRIKEEEMNIKKYFENNFENWEKLYFGTQNSTAIGVAILLKILPLNKSEAYNSLIKGVYLKEIDKNLKLDEKFAKELIRLTHPEKTKKVAFITSQDMVAKAGAWGALGSWDFFNPPKTKEEFYSKAKFYQELPTKKIDENKIISFLPRDLNGDGVISQGEGLVIKIYNNSIFIGKEAVKAYIFANNTLIKSKGKELSLDLLYLKDKNKVIIMNKGLINATFTRMWFLDGYGLRYFKKEFEINNPKIIVWSLNK